MEVTHALCLKTVEDDEGIYCIAGKMYEILEEDDDTYLIESEESDIDDGLVDSIRIRKDDPDFKFYSIGADLSTE